MQHSNRNQIIAGVSGLLLAFLLGYFFITTEPTHPVGTSSDTKVHVHGDFQMYLNDERIRFTDDKYQSSAEQTHHASLHFHDGNDEVIHRHANGVTLKQFFESIKIDVTNDCITMDTAEKFCNDDTRQVQLFVNGTLTEDVDSYIFAEEDRILLYYGNPQNQNISKYIAGITDLSCMYSGTCPERGTPPTESCGLTCEVADLANTQSKNWLHIVKDFFTGN